MKSVLTERVLRGSLLSLWGRCFDQPPTRMPLSLGNHQPSPPSFYFYCISLHPSTLPLAAIHSIIPRSFVPISVPLFGPSPQATFSLETSGFLFTSFLVNFFHLISIPRLSSFKTLHSHSTFNLTCSFMFLLMLHILFLHSSNPIIFPFIAMASLLCHMCIHF